jgi:hypothetical protein
MCLKGRHAISWKVFPVTTLTSSLEEYTNVAWQTLGRKGQDLARVGEESRKNSLSLSLSRTEELKSRKNVTP